MNPANLNAVLLAGGESSRMGRDKATLEVGGQPLWQHQLALLESLQPAEIFVSARTDPHWRPSNTIFVPDEPPSVGPLSGIAATLRKIRRTHLLVLAIDLPWMTAAVLRALVEQLPPDRGIVPVIGNRAEPLVAIYPAHSFEYFSTALAGPDFSLQTIVRKMVESGWLSLEPVSAENKELFRNLNSPADLLH